MYSDDDLDEEPQKPVRWLQAELPPPKKAVREKKLSVNIQKFLARKEEEEKSKQLDAERKKQELLTLRAQDKKSMKRVQSMLKRTKSANKSVIEDAVDNVNTAVTAAGPLQPDEDDYGYVSKDASDLYDKLINKYKSMPSEESPFKSSVKKKVNDIASTKDRVKAALQREEEEKFLPRKRKSKLVEQADSNGEGGSDKEAVDIQQPEPEIKQKPSNKFKIPKRNPQAPPPPDFETLLKIAEQKKNEPIIIKKFVENKPERPMTKKEKDEYMMEQERKRRREMGLSSINSTKGTSKHLLDKASKPSVLAASPAPKSEAKDLPDSHEKKMKFPVDSKHNSLSSSEKKSKPNDCDKTKPKDVIQDVKKNKDAHLLQQRLKNSTSSKITESEKNKEIVPKSVEKLPEKLVKNVEKKIVSKSSQISPKESFRHSMTKDAIKQLPSKDTSRQLPSKDSVRQFPPKDTIHQFPSKDLSSQGFSKDLARRFPPPDMRRKPTSNPVFRRKVIESDDEYDSEMDDFIDDSEDQTDISKHISDIFGYDRRRYANMDDDDDECMESNFTQLQKEEFISTKQGILDDLADVRRTKMMKLKKKIR